MKPTLYVLTTHTFAAFALAAALAPARSHADETTIETTTPGKYTETQKGHGSEYKYQQNGDKSSEAYQGHGEQMKTTSNGEKTKQVYEGKGCEEKSVSNNVTGESKTVSEGKCAH